MEPLAVIAAIARNGVIGRDGDLPWRLPDDLKHFKATTLGHCLIVGRRTWESLPGALPGRTSIVVTRSRHYQAKGALVAHDVEGAIALARSRGDDEPCVAGIEMGEPGGHVDDADRWVRESLDYLARALPDLTR